MWTVRDLPGCVHGPRGAGLIMYMEGYGYHVPCGYVFVSALLFVSAGWSGGGFPLCT